MVSWFLIGCSYKNQLLIYDFKLRNMIILITLVPNNFIFIYVTFDIITIRVYKHFKRYCIQELLITVKGIYIENTYHNQIWVLILCLEFTCYRQHKRIREKYKLVKISLGKYTHTPHFAASSSCLNISKLWLHQV